MSKLDVVSICSLELEDYIALKQYAYNYIEKGYSRELPKILNYVTKVLEYRLQDPEALIFIYTTFYPFDTKFCEVYRKEQGNFENIGKHFPKVINSKDLLVKFYEVKKYHLDSLIENGILTPPIPEDIAKSTEKLENPRKNA